MAKRLVVCMDGTGNATELRTSRLPSNVLHVARAVRMIADDDTVQVTDYIPGVGTLPFVGKCWHQITGRGLSQDVQHAYEFLAHNFDPRAGDKIFIFGFSRGATAARSLSGFSELFGIIPKAQMRLFKHAWAYYQRQTDCELKRLRRESSVLADLAEQGQTLKALHLKHIENPTLPHPQHEQVWESRATQYNRLPLHFLGVFDTVAALRGEGFHERHLAWNVDYAYHALGVHELRKVFRPELWEQACDHQTVAQVWFPGTHSDVGGGNGNLGLSSIALNWMVRKATHRNLALDEAYLNPTEVGPEDPVAELKIGRFPYGPGMIAARTMGEAFHEFHHPSVDKWRARYRSYGWRGLDRAYFTHAGKAAAALGFEPGCAAIGAARSAIAFAQCAVDGANDALGPPYSLDRAKSAGNLARAANEAVEAAQRAIASVSTATDDQDALNEIPSLKQQARKVEKDAERVVSGAATYVSKQRRRVLPERKIVIVPSLKIRPPAASATVGASYDSSLTSDGGSGIRTYAVNVSDLPNGLTLDSATGAIAGIPTTPGVFTFTAVVTDGRTPPRTASRQCTIEVRPKEDANDH